MIRSLTFQRDVRTFKVGTRLDLNRPVVALVGDQGAGKSTLLGLLACELMERPAVRGVDMVRGAISLDVDLPTRAMWIDFESNNPHNASHFKEEGNVFAQLKARFVSHGQVTRDFLGLLQKLEVKPGMHGAVLLDEPDGSLSPRSVLRLARGVREAGERGLQVIMSVHNPWLIEAQSEVLSIEHGQWMTPTDYLNQQRELPAEEA